MPLRSNHGAVVVGAIALLVTCLAVGCGSGDGGAAPDAQTTAATVVDQAGAEAALVDFARQAGADVVYSPVVAVGGSAVAVVAYGSPEQVDVVRFEGGSWGRVTTLAMPIGAVVATGIQGPGTCAMCIEVADLTGSTDFLVTLLGADHAQLVVLEVADTARSARIVPFDQQGELLAAVRNGVVDGQTITSNDNDCIPNCAEGTSTYTQWSYDPTAEMFRPDVGD